METFVHRVTSHNIHSCLSTLLGSLEEIQENWNINDTYAIEVIERAKYAVVYIQKTIESADPLLISTTMLDHIVNVYNQQVVGQISSFKQNRTVSHIHNIDIHIMTMIQYASSITVTKTTDDVLALRESMSTFRRSISQQISKSQGLVQELSQKTQQEIQGLSQNSSEVLDELKQNVSTQLENFSSEVSSLNKTIQQIEKDIIANKESFDIQLQEYTDDISKFMSDVRSDYQKGNAEWTISLDKKKTEFDNMLTAQKEILENTIQISSAKMNELTTSELRNLSEDIDFLKMEINRKLEEEYSKIQNLWKYLETKKAEVEVLAGKVAVSSMAGHYKQIADREDKSEVFWKRVTTGVFMLLISLTILNAYLLSNTTDEFSLGKYLPKIAVELVAASFLWFCIRQVTVHRKHERYNRQIHLELASLEPYTASLGEDVTNEIKKSLADKLFGRAEQMIGISTSDDKPTLYDQDTLIKLLDKLGNIVKK